VDGTEGTATTTDPDLERLEAISQELLAEGGEAEADGQFGGGKPSETAANPDATAAGGQPPEGTTNEDGGDGQGSEKTPKWVEAMPESLRGRLSELSEDEVTYLQEQAENGLRQSDYSRLVGQLPKKEDLETLMQRHRALQAIEANPEAAVRLLMDGKDPSGAEDPPESVETMAQALMEKTDPAEFASTFSKILQMHGESVKESLKSEAASTPQAKGRTVNTATKAVRAENYPDVSDEAWARACTSFQKSCEDRGADWRDVNPDHLDFLLEPHVALAKALNNGSTKPEVLTEPRAAALPPGQAGTGTKTLDPWVVEGREPQDDEIFEKTLGKFNLTEQQLARLRANG